MPLREPMTDTEIIHLAQRRCWLKLAAVCATTGFIAPAMALSLSDLTNADASSGIKAALAQGAQVAVSQLGQQGGFWNRWSMALTALPKRLCPWVKTYSWARCNPCRWTTPNAS